MATSSKGIETLWNRYFKEVYKQNIEYGANLIQPLIILCYDFSKLK